MNNLHFYFVTLFPELFAPVLDTSLLKKAQKNQHVTYDCVPLRDFATDPHKTVDDRPYGGGEGMLFKPDVLYSAWNSIPRPTNPSQKQATLLLSPQGVLLTQKKAQEWATYSSLILICGHYEGVDQRFIDLCVDEEVSIGDYVLTGGELPSLVLADTITRLVPGVVGNPASLSEESLEKGLLKYPQYTRPPEFLGHPVPNILLSGNHAAIERWRKNQSIENTQNKRPDLWEKFLATKEK